MVLFIMKIIPIFALSALFLVGCGGSDGDSASPTTTTTNNEFSNPIGEVDEVNQTADSTNNSNTYTLPGSNEFAEMMLNAVNQVRSEVQQCGDTTMPPVPALTWDYDLEHAAFVHSSDMANVDFMDHTGSDGSSPGNRISATGYEFSAWAENVAVGHRSIETVMASWMVSEGHCKNIMSADITQIGASAVVNPDTRYGTYWTQVFARPR